MTVLEQCLKIIGKMIYAVSGPHGMEELKKVMVLANWPALQNNVLYKVQLCITALSIKNGWRGEEKTTRDRWGL